MIHTDGRQTIANSPGMYTSPRACRCGKEFLSRAAYWACRHTHEDNPGKDKRPWRVRELMRSLIGQGYSEQLAEEIATKVVNATIVIV